MSRAPALGQRGALRQPVLERVFGQVDPVVHQREVDAHHHLGQKLDRVVAAHVARGLAVRTKQPADTFRLEPRSAKVRVRLQTPISLNYSQPELLLVILRRLEKEGEIRILVDWQSLAAEGWNADGEGTLSVQDRPLGEALSELLRPMDLTWRAIDEQTVQVTTLSALHQTLELEVYPAGNLAADAGAGNALLARLRASLTPAENEESRGALFFDPVSGSILASLPQPQQQQVEKLLEEWGK